jgi:NAD(P)H-hydrate epimerase
MTANSFITDDGVTVPAISAEAMREVDRIATEEVGPNLFQMMENAGRALAATTLELLGPDWRSVPILVLAGTGGNGGGVICAARHLANRGCNVSVVVSAPERLSPVPAQQLRVYRGTAGRLLDPEGLRSVQPGLILDGLLAYGIVGAAEGMTAMLIERARDYATAVISLDVPSGLDATTGQAAGVHVLANLTLTLALPKKGLDVEAVGELHLADLGIPAAVYRKAGLHIPADIFGDRFIMRLRPGSAVWIEEPHA